MYPETEPYDHGLLDVGDGHRVYWEVCGNPDGKPAVVIHGGPGSGAGAWWRRYFDPAKYKVVLFDQRELRPQYAGRRRAGRGPQHQHHRPPDRGPRATPQHLGIEKWLLLGASWGATLGLAYAEQHPDAISEIVLFSVTNTTRREVEWITRDMGRIFPEEWARFRDGVPEDQRDGNLALAYSRLLHDPDPAVRDKAARDWCDWEDTHVRTHPGWQPDSAYDDPSSGCGFARLVTHYWGHAAWLDEGVLVAKRARLAGIPGVLIHGRLDISSPPDIAVADGPGLAGRRVAPGRAGGPRRRRSGRRRT